MDHFKHHWRRTPSSLRKVIVFVVGWLIVVAGLIMLVTPGPGWAAIFLGFAILATEYTSAMHTKNFMVKKLKAIISYLKKIFKIK